MKNYADLESEWSFGLLTNKKLAVYFVMPIFFFYKIYVLDM